jgi:hypothetical protein
LQRALFVFTIFLSSSLLFLVQPLIARMILPAFGGSPAVWTGSMVFFQAFLLLGYAYAHFSTKYLGVARQSGVHILLLVAGSLTLPFLLPKGSGAIGTENPTWGVLVTLALMVGPTFFAISAGAPLIQRWFSTTQDKDAKDPYFLYGASNLGSMLALLSYPFIVEPNMFLTAQTLMWKYGYLALCGTMAICALVIRFQKRPVAGSEISMTPANIEVDPPTDSVDRPLTWRDRGLWIALSAVPSSLLLGVTAFLSTNIAPVPLLWVVPLSIYLLTFILAFAKRPLLSPRVLGRAAPLLVTPLALMVILGSDKPLVPIAAFHLIAFFVLAWMCHARLHETRPGAQHLTEFYMWLSVGGVLGGIFNAIVAPAIFNTLAEYPIAIVLALMLRPDIAKPRFKFAWLYPLAILAITIAGIEIGRQTGLDAGPLRTMLSVGLPIILCIFAMDSGPRYALALGGVFLAANLLEVTTDADILVSHRSFFGIHRVSTEPSRRWFSLLHGNTLHGRQDRKHPATPLTYYHPSGPIGHVFLDLKDQLKTENIGLIGLGVGSLAAYGQPGQHMTYFEIDPAVRAIATNPQYFTFLSDSEAHVDIVLGDARLTLTQEPDGKYGLIVVDAFSSDAIPVHLLVKEAFQMYMRKLKPHGLLAVHISNRYLDLEPVVSRIAGDLGLYAALFTDAAMPNEKDAGKTDSNWILMSRSKADFGPLLKDPNWTALEPDMSQPEWTDEYSNVLGVFKTDE